MAKRKPLDKNYLYQEKAHGQTSIHFLGNHVPNIAAPKICHSKFQPTQPADKSATA